LSSFWLILKQQWTIKISPPPLFSIFSLAAILVEIRDHQTHVWKGAIQGPFHQSLVAIGPVVSEERLKCEMSTDGRRMKSDGNRSPGLKARWAKKWEKVLQTFTISHSGWPFCKYWLDVGDVKNKHITKDDLHIKCLNVIKSCWKIYVLIWSLKQEVHWWFKNKLSWAQLKREFVQLKANKIQKPVNCPLI
jgi:hypothetical protein